MPQPEDVSLLARYVKLLGDRGRLAIVGLVAARARTRDELQEELSFLAPAALARHLKLLQEEDWIECEPDGSYSLKLEALTTLRAALARVENAPAEAERHEDVEDTLIHSFFDQEGRLRGVPTQRARREMALRHIAERCFIVGRLYEEQEVNNLLLPLYEDYYTLRRALVASGILESRDGNYWLSLRKNAPLTSSPTGTPTVG